MLTINVPYTVQLQGTCIVFHCSNSEVQHMGFYISLDVSGFMLQHLELMCSEFSAAAEVSVIEVLSSQLLNSMMLMMMPSDSTLLRVLDILGGVPRTPLPGPTALQVHPLVHLSPASMRSPVSSHCFAPGQLLSATVLVLGPLCPQVPGTAQTA